MARCNKFLIGARFAIALVLGLSSPAPVTSDPAPVPDATFDRIGANALASGRAPGFVFAVVRGGKIVYQKGFGVADVARATPVTPETRFPVGSITKQFTAASILLLAQRHQLSIDDPLSDFVPDFPNAKAITLRMLLNQTAGLHNYPKLDEHPWPTSGPIALPTIVSILATDRPDAAPGTKWAYSNAHYAMLSAAIAKASGMGESAFLAANVFAPLAMTSSGFGFAAQQNAALATSYSGRGTFNRPVKNAR